MFNPTTFFSYVRRFPFGGRLSQAQIDGMNCIIKEWDRSGYTDLRHLSYIFATAFHETGTTMQPINEKGGNAYFTKLYDVTGQNPDRARKYGNTSPGDGIRYHGRGFSQLTWKDNYRKASKVTGVDLVANPDRALEPVIAANIIIDGMVGGWYTGRKLGDYFNAVKDDPIGARYVVNGTDKAKLIAGYYKAFYDAFKAADVSTPQPTDVSREDAKADDIAPSKSGEIITTIATGASGVGTLGLLNIDNPYALGALALVLVAAGIIGYMFYTGRLEVKRS